MLITLSHFEGITWIIVPYLFLEKIFSYVVLWLYIDDKVNWLGAQLRRWQRKQNVKRWMWIVSQPNWHESFHLVDRGQNPLKLLHFIMTLNTTSSCLTKHDQQKVMKIGSSYGQGSMFDWLVSMQPMATFIIATPFITKEWKISNYLKHYTSKPNELDNKRKCNWPLF
jgi:hypothetical protein